MSSFSDSAIGKAVMGQSTKCLQCGATITFQEGASLAMKKGHHNKVMCSKCSTVFSVELTSVSMTLKR